MKRWLAVAVAAAITALLVASSSAGSVMPGERLGVILLHGKMGTPLDGRTGLAVIGRKLELDGALVALPSMAWGPEWEHINSDVAFNLEEIDGMVASLRARGARRIVIVGHSLGADMGLAYAVTRGGLAGLVMAAPGHRPEDLTRRDETMRNAVAQAHLLVESGHPNEPFVGPDGIQGYNLTLRTTAEAYYSWMDPAGLAAMEVQAPRLPASIPLLMIVGRRDPFHRDARAKVYQPAARHPYSRYVQVGAGHSSTPIAAASIIRNWVEDLPR